MAALDYASAVLAAREPTLAEKVAFLSRPDAYPSPVSEVMLRETHMSWVFLAGDRVYKLKKPVRFLYLDFSTLERREAACRAEVSLNRRLAPNVYIGVAPLAASAGGLCIAAAPAHRSTGWWSCTASTTGGPWSRCCTKIVSKHHSSTV